MILQLPRLRRTCLQIKMYLRPVLFTGCQSHAEIPHGRHTPKRMVFHLEKEFTIVSLAKNFMGLLLCAEAPICANV